MRRAAVIVTGAVGFVSAVVALARVPGSFWAELYPLPLVVLLIVVLLVALAYVAWGQRKLGDRDQVHLNRVFRVLPREAVRRLQFTNFLAGWEDRTIYPFNLYAAENGEVEDQFVSRKLEDRRARLHAACVVLSDAEAYKGWDARREGRRNTGWSAGEIEDDPARQQVAMGRATELEAAASAVRRAHERLVTAAKRRGLDLSSLELQPPEPPWLEGN